MNLSETRKGEVAILSKAFIAALFPIITVFSFSYLPPFISLIYTYVISLIFLAVLITFKKRWGELLNKEVLLAGFLISLFIGVGFYGFYYPGLKKTTVGNAAVVVLMEVFFSFLFFNVWKKEYFSKKHVLGALLMIAGALFVLLPRANSFKGGDILILLACVCAPFGNNLQQKLRKKISSENILFLRTIFAIPFLFLLSRVFNEEWTLGGFQKSLLFLLFNGVLHFGLTKILWLEGIHRISVTKASALNSSIPFITLGLSYFLLKQTPTIWQLLALFPLVIGVLLLTSKTTDSQSLGPE